MRAACGNVANAHSGPYLCAVHKLALDCAGRLPFRRYYLFKFKGYDMSGSFDDRRKGFESKWAHDAEMQFKIMARRNKLLGLWAAGEMGMSGEKADAYAKAVIASDFEEPGDEDVFRKVRGDLDAAKFTDHTIRHKMDRSAGSSPPSRCRTK